jgi:FtsH-binding integral membrane protein
VSEEEIWVLILAIDVITGGRKDGGRRAVRDSAECAHRIIATTTVAAATAATNGHSRLLEPMSVQVAVAFVRRRSSLVKLDLFDCGLVFSSRFKSEISFLFSCFFSLLLFSYFIFAVSLGGCDNNTQHSHCASCVCAVVVVIVVVILVNFFIGVNKKCRVCRVRGGRAGRGDNRNKTL